MGAWAAPGLKALNKALVTMFAESALVVSTLPSPAFTDSAHQYLAWMIPGAIADDFKVTPSLSS
jgi:hypothetical protein